MIRRFFYSKRKEKQLSKVLVTIAQADDAQITQIIQAVIRRYEDAFPDWDVLFLSVPREPVQRREQLEQMLEKLKDSDLL